MNKSKNFINYLKPIIFITVLLFSIVVMFYSFGFSTTWQQAHKIIADNRPLLSPLFERTHEVNNQIALTSVIAVALLVVSMFVGTHHRKKYYLSNYLLLGLFASMMLICSVLMILGVHDLIDKFQQSFDNPALENIWIRFFDFINVTHSREDVIASLSLGYVIAVVGVVASILSLVLITISIIQRPALIKRELEVKELLSKIENNDVLVEEKVVNLVPSIDDELDLSDQSEIVFKKVVKLDFYQTNKKKINIALICLVLFTFALASLFVYSFIADDLMMPGLLGYLQLIAVLTLFLNFKGIKSILELKKDVFDRFSLIVLSIYLLLVALPAGVLLLMVAIKLPDDNNAQRLRYQKNSFGFNFAMLSLLFFLMSLFTSLTYSPYYSNSSNQVIPDLLMALDILIAIVLLLMTVLAAEKVKAYISDFAWVLIVIAVINISRVFFIPLRNLQEGQIPLDVFLQISIGHYIAAALAVMAGVVSLIKSHQLKTYLRGIGGK